MGVSPVGGRGRPTYRQPALVSLVVVGGTVGTALRDRLETLFAAPAGGFPWVTFCINVSGAFLLGVLLEVLAAVVGEGRRRRGLQVAFGTGLLGGYTTYSTFVLEALAVAAQGDLALAVAYVVGSVLVGFGAAYAAMWLTRSAVRVWGTESAS